MKLFLTSFILLILALASYKLLLSVENELDAKVEPEQTKIIATLYDASGAFYNNLNQLQYNVSSKQVREYSNHFGTEFDDITVKNYTNKSLDWTGSANFATMSADKNNLMLKDNVSFTKSPNTANSIKLKGSVIYYDAIQKKAFSYESVSVKDNTMQQQNNNFSLDIDSGKLTFDSGVKANYDSKQP